jgi:glycosyltransferase involved in cell wall biosynthesis
MFHSIILARLSRPFVPGPAIVSTIHNQAERGRRYDLYRRTDRLGDLTTAVSQRAYDAALGRRAAPPRRLTLVPNGLDPRPYRSDGEARIAMRDSLGIGDRFLWLAAGRFTPEKDYPTMVAAFRLVRERRPDARLMIAGEGDLEPAVRSAIAQAGLDDTVTLLGLRPDVPRLMQAADGFLLSSASEGLPMVLLEAAASGLPIVTTAIGGSDEIVVDGSSGCVVPIGDPGAIAQAIIRVMEMPGSGRRAMGEEGRRIVRESFAIDAIAERWEDLYVDLIRRRRPGSVVVAPDAGES